MNRRKERKRKGDVKKKIPVHTARGTIFNGLCSCRNRKGVTCHDLRHLSLGPRLLHTNKSHAAIGITYTSLDSQKATKTRLYCSKRNWFEILLHIKITFIFDYRRRTVECLWRWHGLNAGRDHIGTLLLCWLWIIVIQIQLIKSTMQRGGRR